jgi:hypothetical protein
MHQFEQHRRIHVHHRLQTGLDAEMQHDEAFVSHTNEDRDAERPAVGGHREQSLHSRNVSDADTQAPVPLENLRRSISLYGLLDANADAVLIDIEKDQLLQGGTLLYG